MWPLLPLARGYTVDRLRFVLFLYSNQKKMEDLKVVLHAMGKGGGPNAFDDSAHKILKHYAIVVTPLDNVQTGKKTWFRIREIEFYLRSSLHMDPFTHEHPLQAETGRWCVTGSD